MRPKVLHLINDAQFGGIQSALRSLQASTLVDDFDFDIQIINLKQYSFIHYKADVLCLHQALSWHVLPKLLLLKLRHLHTPFIYQEHHYCDGFVKQQITKPKRFFLMLKLSYSIMTKIISVSQSQAQWIKKHNLIPPHKLFILKQGEDLHPFTHLGIKKVKKTYIFGAYGRMHTQKGFDTLINAMKLIQHKDIQLKIAGSGEQEDALKKQASSLANVQFIGVCHNIPDFLNQCDAIIIPSRWEPFGLVFQEAMAAGKPILHSGVDGLNEQSALLDNQQNEGLFEQSAESIAKSILECIQSPPNTLTPKQRSQMQQKWNETLSQWKNLLNTLKK
ncbi:glycosyltransferase [uncultured Shewanella sp.]|uniref:glycosyltransferase n=1 Tax=uncultured Shewanella sp. TaxID=173975 RepID=UPI00261DBB56|nr:glycosyltransferase [uncultured Shewanella sp.]